MSVQILPGSNIETQVPLNRLVSLKDAGFADWEWCYRPLDKDHIEHLVASEMSAWDAIELVQVNIGGEVYSAIVSGNHRRAAASIKKAATIKGIAKTYADEAAVIEAAFLANFKHGLPASTQTRSDFAIWLYDNDPSDKPNLSAIARKVGLNQSTVSRAISRMQKEAQADEEEASQGASSRAETDNAGKLVTALQRFFESERSVWDMFGDNPGRRDINARARAIARYVSRLGEQKQGRAVKELVSLQATLNVFVTNHVSRNTQQKTASEK